MKSHAAARPTDEELMLYADGELDEASVVEVEAHLANDAASRQKILALRLAGELVRERALEDTSAGGLADGIADAVMAKIAAGAEANGASPPDAAKVVDLGDRRAALRGGARDGVARKDTGRSIMMFAAVAVAAAAGMMIWGRTEAPPPAQSAVEPTPASAPAERLAPPAPEETAEAPTPEGELEVGVQVAAVDFGAKSGTIFYVPNGSAAVADSVTTVVWVDDVGGE